MTEQKPTKMKTFRATIQISATTFVHFSLNADNMKSAIMKASERGMVISIHPSSVERATEYTIK